MAKTIQYTVQINTSRAEDDLNELDNQLDDIQEKSKIDLLIESADAVKSVGDVRKAYKALRDAQIEVGEGTEEFTRLGQAAAGLKDKLDAVNEVSKDLGGSTFEKFKNSLGRIKEGIVNLDLDKTKQGFTQLGTTFKGLTSGLSTARLAAIGFGTALAATGIAAIVGAVALLIKNFDELKESGGLVGNVLTSIGNTIDFATKKFKDFTDFLGLTDFKNAEFNENQKKRSEELLDVNKAIEDATVDLIENSEERKIAAVKLGLKRKIAAIKTTGPEETRLRALFERQAEREISNIKKEEAEKRAKAESDRLLKEAKDKEDEAKKTIEKQKQRYNAELDEIDKFFEEERTKITLSYAKRQIDKEEFEKQISNSEVQQRQVRLANEIQFGKDVVELQAEQAKAQADLRTASDNAQALADKTRLDNIDKIIDKRKDFAKNEIEIAKLEIEGFDQKIALLEAEGIREGELYEKLIEQKGAAELKLRDATIQYEKDKAQARLDAAQQGLIEAQNFSNAIQGLSDAIFANELANAQGNAEEEEKIRKKAFEANKALGIVNAVISTAQAVISGFNAGASMGPAGVVMGPVMAALAGVTGAIQIATIASSQYTPTGGGTAATTVAPPSPSTPASLTPNVTFAGEGTGLNQVGGGANQFMNLSASVSISEINNVQNQVAVYETGSLLGGGGG